MQSGTAPARAGWMKSNGTRVRTWAWVGLVAAALAGACTDETSTEPTPGQKPVATVAVAPKATCG
jgi:hypothetical protein